MLILSDYNSHGTKVDVFSEINNTIIVFIEPFLIGNSVVIILTEHKPKSDDSFAMKKVRKKTTCEPFGNNK